MRLLLVILWYFLLKLHCPQLIQAGSHSCHLLMHVGKSLIFAMVYTFMWMYCSNWLALMSPGSISVTLLGYTNFRNLVRCMWVLGDCWNSSPVRFTSAKTGCLICFLLFIVAKNLKWNYQRQRYSHFSTLQWRGSPNSYVEEYCTSGTFKTQVLWQFHREPAWCYRGLLHVPKEAVYQCTTYIRHTTFFILNSSNSR